MKIYNLLFFNLIFLSTTAFSQTNPMHEILNQSYSQFREPELSKRRIKQEDINPLLSRLNDNDKFEVSVIGESVKGKPISMVSYGTGPVNVLLWSQMHGDESTATQALFDIFNFLDDDEILPDIKKMLRGRLSIHFIPMLNPDGAELHQRRNALNIDINRDALRLQTPEGRLLQSVRDSLNADFGFNLHDQSRYYNVEGTPKPASISVLAPAFNQEKDINQVRSRAMQVIVRFNKLLQKYAAGHVGRYSDDFEIRAFGDNIQKWGTSTILIESGGYPDDREKQFIRKLNYMAILDALWSIADDSYLKESVADYEKIPENAQKIFDLKISEVRYKLDGNSYLLDIGINRKEIDHDDHRTFFYESTIEDIGDLSTYYGYELFDANGLELVPGKVYAFNKSSKDLSELDVIALLKSGYGYVALNEKPETRENKFPLHLVDMSFEPSPEFAPDDQATFFLRNQDRYLFAIINGFMVDLTNNKYHQIINTLVLER